MLKWANGLDGKLNRLLLPLPARKEKKDALKKLNLRAREINKKRNEVAHSGHFMNENEAREVLTVSCAFIDTLVSIYYPNYLVDDAANQLKNSKTNE